MYTFLSYTDGELVKLVECRMTFQIGVFELLVDFNSEPLEDVLSTSESYIEITCSHKELLSVLPISNIALRFSVYIYEDTVDLYPLEFETANLYKAITSQFPQIFKNIPTVGPLCVEDPCDGLGCPEYGYDYGWETRIDNVYWNSEFLYTWLENYDITSDCPSFYYDCTYKLADALELKILNISTKVRRLGYLKLLVSFFKEKEQYPISKFLFAFEQYCSNFAQFLDQRSGSKGNIIETKTGNSAKPYIELGLALGLIRKDTFSYKLGKVGKTFATLKNIIDDSDKNVFDLTKFDIFFFLERLLYADYWYLRVIIKYIFENDTVSNNDIRLSFQELLLKDISLLINDVNDQNQSKVLPLKIIERRIKAWTKPYLYMDHVVTPRINWLLDLGIIELTQNQCLSLTWCGEQLLYNLQLWNDVRKYHVVSPDDFIKTYYCKVMNALLRTRCTPLVNYDIIHKCLNSSFNLFKTLAPNRINFSQFALYVKNILFFKNSILLDEADLINIFEENKILGYICKLQTQYKDGYIQKR